MKTFKPTVLKLSLFASSILVILTIISCSNNSDAKDSKELAEDHNEAKFSNDQQDDAGFLVTAAEIYLEEIQLGLLAQQNSTTPQVMELGKMMEEQHTKALNDLKMLASSKQITIPATLTDDGKDAYDKLKNKAGADFNNDYCDMMVKGHKDAISKFEKIATDAKDEDIRSWATTELINLRIHLDHSIACQQECSKMKI